MEGSVIATVKVLLLQIREQDDPMLVQECHTFAEALNYPLANFRTLDLLYNSLTAKDLEGIEAVIIGGSGNYSVTSEEPWLHTALESIRLLYSLKVPTFASCWGFQAVCRALGGEVRTDLSLAELGSVETYLTSQGQKDWLFGSLPQTFYTMMGHEDIVFGIPEEAILLASTEKVRFQAITFPDRLFYATQFHPELTRKRFLQRAVSYPKYVEKISGLPWEEFEKTVFDSPETATLLTRFIQRVEQECDS